MARMHAAHTSNRQVLELLRLVVDVARVTAQDDLNNTIQSLVAQGKAPTSAQNGEMYNLFLGHTRDAHETTKAIHAAHCRLSGTAYEDLDVPPPQALCGSCNQMHRTLAPGQTCKIWTGKLASFLTVCSACNKPIEPGVDIARGSSASFLHLACAVRMEYRLDQISAYGLSCDLSLEMK